MKNDFHFPPILKFPNIPGALAGESLGEIMKLFDGLDWDDVTFVREASGLPAIGKGPFSPDDAKAANVRVPAAKCKKHLLFRHHAKVDVHLWICALECPKCTGKDLNSGGTE